ncbi:MAG TPA: trigger factor [Dehalococcoidia bacterium]|nr:trigger factor [Dehalococcoidia bacterium]
MKVSTERIPDSQVVLEIEVEPERMEKSLEKAYRRLAQRAKVPGFRKGKAPRAMLERYLGSEAIRHEALDILIPEAYRQAITEEKIEPIDLPAIEVTQEEPLVFKATVPVRPSIDLGDYRAVRVEREPPAVREERVDEQIEELRHRYALLEPVERAVQVGDMVRAEVQISVDGRQVFREEDAEFRLRQGAAILLPGFAEALPGGEKGQRREFGLDVPADFPQRVLAGRSCQCSVLVKEVKEERLPEITDAFAREVGEGFPSLAALRERLTADLREAAEREADGSYREKVVDAMVAVATLEFPPQLVDREVDRLLQDRANASGAADVEAYLRDLRKPEEDLRQELRWEAIQRVQNSLVLSKLAEAEGIAVSKDDIDAEIERLAVSAGPRVDEVRRMFAGKRGREALESSLFTRRTLDRLVAIASGEEVPSPAGEGESNEE